MTRKLLLAALCAFAVTAQAGVYQCIDAKGRRVFSDKGCSGDLKDRRSQRQQEQGEQGGVTAIDGGPAASRPSTSSGTYGLTDRRQTNLKENYTRTIKETEQPSDR